jgi:YegS/Rv2252/BmrU family lipid kinase
MQTATDDPSAAAGRRLLVIHNPTAGAARARRYRATLAELERLGCRLDVRDTGARGDAEVLAREAAAAGVRRVVAAGGDGTINEVVNGLAGSATALALLPLGTANVLAAEIGLDPDPAAVARTIAAGRETSICLGRVRGAVETARVFTNMAGVGADAHAVAGVSLALKRRIGKGAYFAEALRQLFVFPFPRYRVTVDGTVYEAASAVVANGRYYAGRYVLAPEARLTAPTFHVCLFTRPGRLAALAYAAAMQRGTLPARRDYRIVTGTHVAIAGPPGDPVQADGDIVARLPVDIEPLPDALRLVLPE